MRPSECARALTLCLLPLAGCLSAGDEASEPGAGHAAAASNDAITIPVMIHMVIGDDVRDRFMPVISYPELPSQPVFSALGFRADVRAVEARLDLGARPTRFSVVGTRYVRDDGVTPCAQLTAVPDALLATGALHIVAAKRCRDAVALNSPFVVSSAEGVAQGLGRVLGLRPTDYHRNDLSLREPLHRDLDDTHATSCYRTGDSLCDTQADYGQFHPQAAPADTCPAALREVGDDRFYCEQLGPLCTSTESRRCAPFGQGGRRWYNPFDVGYAFGTTDTGLDIRPSLVMSGPVHGDGFTDEQRARMEIVARWRANRLGAVTTTEQRILHDVPGMPISEGWWAQSASRAWHLTPLVGAAVSSPLRTSTPLTNGAFEATLSLPGNIGPVVGWQLDVEGDFEVYPTTQITVATPWGATITVPYTAGRKSNGFTTFDEAHAEGLTFVEQARGLRGAGAWRVRIADPANPTGVRSVTLTVRSRPNNHGSDRNGDGYADVMVYRSAYGLYTSANQLPGASGFTAGAYTFTSVATFESMHAGDINGDGRADLVAFTRAGEVHVALSRDDLRVWRRTSIGSSTSVSPTSPFVLGDFDGDGAADLMIPGSGLPVRWWFYRSNADGTFADGVTTTFEGTTANFVDAQIMAADVTADGRTDLMVRERATDRTWLYRNTTARVGAPVTFAAPSAVYIDGSYTSDLDLETIRLLDANGDGRDDLVVRQHGTGLWWYHRHLSPSTYGRGVLLTFNGDSVAYSDTDVILP